MYGILMKRLTYRMDMNKTEDIAISVGSVLENTLNLQELDNEAVIDEMEAIVEDAPNDILDILNSYLRTRRLTFEQREKLNKYYVLYYSIALGTEIN